MVKSNELGVALEHVEATRTSAKLAYRCVVVQDTQPAAVCLGDEVVEVGVISEPRINAVVVGGVDATINRR